MTVLGAKGTKGEQSDNEVEEVQLESEDECANIVEVAGGGFDGFAYEPKSF